MNSDPLIPKSQRGRKQWICFKNEMRRSEQVQIPIDPKDDGYATMTEDGT